MSCTTAAAARRRRQARLRQRLKVWWRTRVKATGGLK